MTHRHFLVFCCFLCWLTTLKSQSPELIIPGGHTRSILKVATSPGGGLVATSGIDEVIKLWETTSGRELHTFRPGDTARGLAFSPDGRYLAVAAFTRIYIYDLTNFQEISSYKGWNMNGVKFSPAKNELYYITQRISSTGEDPQQLFAVSIPGGQPRQLATVPMGANRGIAGLDISPDGKELLVVIPNADGHRVPFSGGAPIAVSGARCFTPEGDLFFLRKSGMTVTMGLSERDGKEIWSTTTNSKDVQHLNMVDVADFHDGVIYWCNAPGKLARGNYRTGELGILEMPITNDYALATASDGSLYVGGKAPYVIYAYDLPKISGRNIIGEELLSPQLIAGAEQANRLSWGGPTVRSLVFDGTHVSNRNHGGSFATGRMYYSGDGSLLTSVGGSGNLFSYHAEQRHAEVVRYKTSFKDARAIATDHAGKYVAVISSDGYTIMNTETNKSVAKGSLSTGDAYFNEHAALSPDGKKLLLSVARYLTDGSNRTTSILRLVASDTNETLWERKESTEYPAFAADGKKLLGEVFENLVILDPTTGRELSRNPLPKGRFPYSTIFNALGEWATYTHDNRAYVYDLKANREYELTVPGEGIRFDRSVFFGDDFVAIAGREGVVRIFDLRTRKLVATLVQYADSEDWAITTPDGRFDATPGAMGKMYYQIGQQRVSLEQLFDGFYTPGLAGEIFGRRPGGAVPPPININLLKPAPSVEIDFREGGSRGLIVADDEPEQRRIATSNATAIITLKGSAPNDRITELRLYQNGKLLGDGTRNLVVEDDVPPPANGQREYRVRLLPGENEFRAVALNSQRTESNPSRLIVTYTSSAPGSSTTVTPTNDPLRITGEATVKLHLVTVGINEYRNTTYNLNYATADAAGVEDGVKRSMSSIVGEISAQPIRNTKATREEIIAALQGIVTKADADDILVFYYAGHGVVSDGENGDFYFVPHDVTQIYGNDGSLASRGISAAEMQRISAAIPAQRQLFILDACQSAGAVEKLRLRGTAENKAIAQLARTTGTHWLTASASDQFANEFDELGHGAFTYVLLQALSGKAAGEDKQVTVNELKAYLDEVVPKMTLQYTGQPQYPASFGYGRDFVVGQ